MNAQAERSKVPPIRFGFVASQQPMAIFKVAGNTPGVKFATS